MKLYTYEELKSFVDRCTRCSLSQTRNRAVMGYGNLNSPILFIAEGPGRNEDKDGLPFTGRSGEMFDRLLSGINLGRKDIYITNIVKCHPPGNRDPLPAEQEACIPYLKYETLLLSPKIIVCLGRIAAQRIIRPDYRITREHGTFIFRKNIWLTSCYHPSAILRDPSKFLEVQEDFYAIQNKLRDI
ncbi:MAG: uracil-DNA glycosylase [Dorea sp.]|jgi:uracil-DNA glycosylase family 4|nr:uracil-DNA glycosylase [Dorea sp.]